MEPLSIIIALVALSAGGYGGYVYRKKQMAKDAQNADVKAEKLIQNAETKAKEIVLEARDEAVKIAENAKKEEKERREQISNSEKRVAQREEALDKKSDELDKKRDDIEKARTEIEQTKTDLREIRVKQQEALEKIAKLTKDEAKDKLMGMIEKDYKKDILTFIKKVEEETKEQADAKAREIISVAMQRVATDQTTESTVTAISLPNDEIKGRIIGREGRNIQALEKATGCDIVVDDTPETIVISGFDPVRRHVAKIALEKLIKDGRIHPARIEEAVEKAQEEMDKSIKEAGEKAVYEAGVAGLPSEMIKLLGRLKFRTSYAQNVLKHSVETSLLAGALATELGADVVIAKKAGLLHDIGKAVDQEIEGSHAVISRDICKKYGISEDVIHAVEAHHEDVPFKSIEAIIVQVSDAISASRPGARRDSLENYIKRLSELENIANSFDGVEKSFAISAGREVRILVRPEQIDDLKAVKLSRDIAKKIEDDLKYPGQIKVNVIRETRAIEYAK
ncbi:MAG: ribonuclease Y [Patescibacteria group bacterium]|nr:ribonuclease Y [Patescibacteria group bacterium]